MQSLGGVQVSQPGRRALLHPVSCLPSDQPQFAPEGSTLMVTPLALLSRYLGPLDPKALQDLQ